MKNIKKIISIVLTAVMLVTALAVCASAEGTEELPWFIGAKHIDNTAAYIRDNVLCVIGYDPIRDFEENEQPWADKADSIFSIKIEKNVSSIGKNAFRHLTGVKTVEILGAITEFAPFSFAGMTSLTNITIPKGSEKIDSYAFADSGLESITVPADIAEIGENAFLNCTALKNIYFGGTVEEWKKAAKCGFDTEVTVHCSDGNEVIASSAAGDGKTGSFCTTETVLIIIAAVEFAVIVALAAVIILNKKKK